ncbi:MAG: lipoate--protein ligase family protein [Lentimonas sp.]
MLVTLPNAFGNAVTNMGIDAALLTTLPQGYAVFRHYGWIEPTITFGYTQRLSEIEITHKCDEITLCRRPTAGGIVDHRDDWTYALILHRLLPAAQFTANQLYAEVHRSIQTALRNQQIASHLAPCPRQCGDTQKSLSATASECFRTPAAKDVLLPNGRKIAGAAMKRSRNGLLIQGSISRPLLPAHFNFDAFQSALVIEISKKLSLPIHTPDDLRPFFDSEKIELEKHRFSSDDWLKKR